MKTDNIENKKNFERSSFHERYYTLYGDIDEPENLDLMKTKKYLESGILEGSFLKQARKSKEIAAYISATFKPAKAGSRYCDFCGAEILGVEYETLADGRDRCMSCGRTSIKTEKEFCKIFEDVKRNMEAFFGIKIGADIRVEMVNSRTLHKKLGKAFIPTPKADGRILGVAISDKNGYSLLVENGSPRMASMLTMAHELTHIWQYLNWNDKDIRRKYGKHLYLQVYEGMAKWVEVQYAYLINEIAVAKREEIITSYREDEYGYGFLRYCANYPFSLGTIITRPTPFLNKDYPLDLQYCGAVVVRRKSPEPENAENIPENETGGGTASGKGESGKSGEKERKPVQGIKERKPGNVHYYAYHLLNDFEKIVYEKFLHAVQNFETVITDLPPIMTVEQVMKIAHYMDRDHPELFWFQYGTTVFQNPTDSLVAKVELKYRMSKEEALKRQKQIDAASAQFTKTITEEMSDYETALRIYENIIRLIDYDTLGLEEQEKDQNANEKPDDLRSIYGVIVNKKAVCAGYAKATQYFMQKAGIECTYIVSAEHAWNLLKLEGEYYHLDTTWGDYSNTKQSLNASDEVSYDCFCITTKEVEKLDQHKVEKELPIPVCTATKCNYYHRQGLYFEKYNFEQCRKVICEKLNQNTKSISIKCADNMVWKEFMKKLITEQKFREIVQYASLKSGIRFSLTYSYTAKEERNILTFYVNKI